METKQLITEITTLGGEVFPLPTLPDQDKLEYLTKGHRNKRGKPTAPLDPLAMVDVAEDGSVVHRKRVTGRKNKWQLALRKISAGLVYDIAKLYYRTPDVKTLCLLTGHKPEFLYALMETVIWQEKLLQVRKELDREEEAKTTAIMHKSLEIMKESLDTGDEVLDSKTGKVIKMKVKGHVAASMAKIASELRKDARNETKAAGNSSDTMVHLNALANKFADLVKKPGDDAKVIDHE